VLAAFTVEAEERAAENRVSSVVAALDVAFQRAASEVAAKSFDAIAVDLVAAQPSAANNGP
jgi:ABC-type uncharacterized transport system auxiliary subunit